MITKVYEPIELGLSGKDIKVGTSYDSPIINFSDYDFLVIQAVLTLTGTTTTGTAVIEFVPYNPLDDSALTPVCGLVGALTSTATGSAIAGISVRGQGVDDTLTGTATISANGASILTAGYGKLRLRATTNYDSATSAVASVRLIAQKRKAG
jgi:hypothetical protein